MDRPSTNVAARSFELVDAQGSVRGRWDCGSDGEPRMAFLDRQGRAVLQLHLETDGTVALTILGPDGALALDVGCWGDGSRGVDVRRKHGSPGSGVSIGADEVPSVMTYHPSGRPAAQVGMNRSGGVGVVLQMDRTDQRGEFALSGDGEAHVGFTDDHGNERALIGVTRQGRGTQFLNRQEARGTTRGADEVDRALAALRRWLGR